MNKEFLDHMIHASEIQLKGFIKLKDMHENGFTYHVFLKTAGVIKAFGSCESLEKAEQFLEQSKKVLRKDSLVYLLTTDEIFKNCNLYYEEGLELVEALGQDENPRV